MDYWTIVSYRVSQTKLSYLVKSDRNHVPHNVGEADSEPHTR
jgi:hypothetical protein